MPRASLRGHVWPLCNRPVTTRGHSGGLTLSGWQCRFWTRCRRVMPSRRFCPRPAPSSATHRPDAVARANSAHSLSDRRISSMSHSSSPPQARPERRQAGRLPPQRPVGRSIEIGVVQRFSPQADDLRLQRPDAFRQVLQCVPLFELKRGLDAGGGDAAGAGRTLAAAGRSAGGPAATPKAGPPTTEPRKAGPPWASMSEKPPA